MINTVVNKSELKTQRGSVYMRPSTWTAISKILKVEGKSFNNLVSELLEDYAQQHRDAIEYYDVHYGESSHEK